MKLYDSVYSNIEPFINFGTTTLEAKSGYGLTLEDEIKTLRVIKRLSEDSPLDIIPTFMGAHAIPPEFKDNTPFSKIWSDIHRISIWCTSDIVKI